MLQVRLQYPERDEEQQILERFGKNAALGTRKPVVVLQQLLEARAELDAVHIEECLKEYLLDLVIATRPGERAKLSEAQQGRETQKALSELAPMLETGASPRASLALLMASKAMALIRGRRFVLPDDVKAAARLALPHRIQLSFEAEAQKLTANDLLEKLLDNLISK